MSTFALSPCQPAGSSSQPWRNIGSPGASHVAAKNAAAQVAGCDSLLAQASPLEGSFACNQRSEFRQGPGGEVVERFPCWLPSGEVEASFYGLANLGPQKKNPNLKTQPTQPPQPWRPQGPAGWRGVRCVKSYPCRPLLFEPSFFCGYFCSLLLFFRLSVRAFLWPKIACSFVSVLQLDCVFYRETPQAGDQGSRVGSAGGTTPPALLSPLGFTLVTWWTSR